MLCNKFKLKYGGKGDLAKFIDNEVQKFLSNDRLTEQNLKQLDLKIMKEAESRDKKSQILDDRRSQRSQSAYSKVSRHSMGARSNKSGGLSQAALNALNDRNSKEQAPDAQSIRSKRSAASMGRRSEARSFATQ